LPRATLRPSSHADAALNRISLSGELIMARVSSQSLSGEVSHQTTTWESRSRRSIRSRRGIGIGSGGFSLRSGASMEDSRSLSPGAQQSGASQILPDNAPDLRGVLLWVYGTRRTSGLPDFASTTSSPSHHVLDDPRKVRLGGLDVYHLHYIRPDQIWSVFNLFPKFCPKTICARTSLLKKAAP